jgi:putative holliday junction resolvase
VTGRLLGVDFGTVRVGLAVCDPDRRIASPLTTYRRRELGRDAEYFRRVVKEEVAVGLVVGLPVHMSGDEGGKAAEARAFGAWLAAETRLPVTFWDERFTSKEADGYMRAANLSPRQRKERLDRVAAQILLQAYLDAGCPPETPPPAFDGSA